MRVKELRSDKIYSKMMQLPEEEKEDCYRYELMKPFEKKWECINIPLKATMEGQPDVVTMSSMGGGYAVADITEAREQEIAAISEDAFWENCKKSIVDSLQGFEQAGISLKVQEYIFTIVLNDPNSPMSKMTGDYCGDGGIPGYIIGSIIPNDHAKKMLPVALAHETNHNVRWQFMQWNPQITLADMIVSEGLAENFAAMMFGEDKIGKWVTETEKSVLETDIKPLIKEHLWENDFRKVSSYLYGDAIMTLQGAEPCGVPYCAGYACGYDLIKSYLNKTGKSIYEATITSTGDIISEMEDYWK